MKKNLLLSGIVFVSVLGVVYQGEASAGASTSMTIWAIDIVRSLTGIVQSIITLCGDGEAKAELIATQETVNKKATGEGGTAASTNTSSGSFKDTLGKAGESEFSGSAYDYVHNSILSRGGNVGYAPIKAVISGDAKTARDTVRAKVISEFFADPKKSAQRTTEYQEKIRKQRAQYIQEAANRHVTLGYRVKGYIQNDLSAISSVPLTGDGELGAIAVDAHTLEQMVKMELVDLTLQIEMMEADAIQFMMHQPVSLMSETKPAS